MMHLKRYWNVGAPREIEEIAEDLSSNSWTLCTAFKTSAGTVWANDSTGPDALQEYAILRQDEKGSGDWKQVESITVSWCDREKLMSYLDEADRSEFDGGNWGSVSKDQLEDNHEPCPYCM